MQFHPFPPSKLQLIQRRPAPAKRRHVLIIEDDGPVRAMLYETLTAHGYRATACAGRGEAVRVSRTCSEPIDLILADLSALGKAGLEEVRQAIPNGCHTGVLLISGNVLSEEVQMVRRELAHPFLGKPFLGSELLDALEGTLTARFRSEDVAR
jgi:DNA-binding response OmpR family regulator